MRKFHFLVFSKQNSCKHIRFSVTLHNIGYYVVTIRLQFAKRKTTTAKCGSNVMLEFMGSQWLRAHWRKRQMHLQFIQSTYFSIGVLYFSCTIFSAGEAFSTLAVHKFPSENSLRMNGSESIKWKLKRQCMRQAFVYDCDRRNEREIFNHLHFFVVAALPELISILQLRLCRAAECCRSVAVLSFLLIFFGANVGGNWGDEQTTARRWMNYLNRVSVSNSHI